MSSIQYLRIFDSYNIGDASRSRNREHTPHRFALQAKPGTPHGSGHEHRPRTLRTNPDYAHAELVASGQHLNLRSSGVGSRVAKQRIDSVMSCPLLPTTRHAAKCSVVAPNCQQPCSRASAIKPIVRRQRRSNRGRTETLSTVRLSALEGNAQVSRPSIRKLAPASCASTRVSHGMMPRICSENFHGGLTMNMPLP